MKLSVKVFVIIAEYLVRFLVVVKIADMTVLGGSDNVRAWL
jgi:hypothetical protein